MDRLTPQDPLATVPDQQSPESHVIEADADAELGSTWELPEVPEPMRVAPLRAW